MVKTYVCKRDGRSLDPNVKIANPQEINGVTTVSAFVEVTICLGAKTILDPDFCTAVP